MSDQPLPKRPNWTSGDVAHLVGGILAGPEDVRISSIDRIEKNVPGSLSFLANRRYSRHVYMEVKRTILVPLDFKPVENVSAALIRVENVYESLAAILSKWQKTAKPPNVVDELAHVHPSAFLDQHVGIGAFSSVGQLTRIGSGTSIADHVTVGHSVTIGRDCIIHPGVRIYDHCSVGDRVVIQANAVIGSEGFGFSHGIDGYRRIPHIGNVVLENDVEIGSNTCIDRASIGSTIVREGAKLDNLIQVAHSVEIGAHAAIAAQSGISGSSRVGEGSQLGGQTGVAGHVAIAPYSMIQAQSGIANDLKGRGKKWYGSPAIPYYSFLRAFSWFRKLPILVKRIEDLEHRIMR